MTVNQNIKVLPDVYLQSDYRLNMVDMPGLQDTEGRDQQTLNEMRDRMRVECP